MARRSLLFKVLIVITGFGFLLSSIAYSLICQFSPANYEKIVTTPLSNQSLDKLIPKLEINNKPYSLALIRGIEFDDADRLNIKFHFDKMNQSNLVDKDMRRLIDYFLSFLTLPEDKLWVNLSPYESDKILPEVLSQLAVGKDMLLADYILKQLTSYLTCPVTASGKKFWAKVKALNRKLTKNNIDINTFYKIWIVPGKITIVEAKNKIFVKKASLKVMLEEDYLALKNNFSHFKNNKKLKSAYDLNQQAKDIFRKECLPVIEEMVNHSGYFAPLRQLYYSFVLAFYCKQYLAKDDIYKKYINKEKIGYLKLAQYQKSKDFIYRQYLKKISRDSRQYREGSWRYSSGGLKFFQLLQGTKEEDISDIFLGPEVLKLARLYAQAEQEDNPQDIAKNIQAMLSLSSGEKKLIYALWLWMDNTANLPRACRMLAEAKSFPDVGLKLTENIVRAYLKFKENNPKEYDWLLVELNYMLTDPLIATLYFKSPQAIINKISNDDKLRISIAQEQILRNPKAKEIITNNLLLLESNNFNKQIIKYDSVDGFGNIPYGEITVGVNSLGEMIILKNNKVPIGYNPVKLTINQNQTDIVIARRQNLDNIPLMFRASLVAYSRNKELKEEALPGKEEKEFEPRAKKKAYDPYDFSSIPLTALDDYDIVCSFPGRDPETDGVDNFDGYKEKVEMVIQLKGREFSFYYWTPFGLEIKKRSFIDLCKGCQIGRDPRYSRGSPWVNDNSLGANPSFNGRDIFTPDIYSQISRENIIIKILDDNFIILFQGMNKFSFRLVPKLKNLNEIRETVAPLPLFLNHDKVKLLGMKEEIERFSSGKEKLDLFDIYYDGQLSVNKTATISEKRFEEKERNSDKTALKLRALSFLKYIYPDKKEYNIDDLTKALAIIDKALEVDFEEFTPLAGKKKIAQDKSRKLKEQGSVSGSGGISNFGSEPTYDSYFDETITKEYLRQQFREYQDDIILFKIRRNKVISIGFKNGKINIPISFGRIRWTGIDLPEGLTKDILENCYKRVRKYLLTNKSQGESLKQRIKDYFSTFNLYLFNANKKDPKYGSDPYSLVDVFMKQEICYDHDIEIENVLGKVYASSGRGGIDELTGKYRGRNIYLTWQFLDKVPTDSLNKILNEEFVHARDKYQQGFTNDSFQLELYHKVDKEINKGGIDFFLPQYASKNQLTNSSLSDNDKNFSGLTYILK